MRMEWLRRGGVLGVVVLVAAAAWLLPRHPVAALVLLMLLLGLLVLRWNGRRAMREVNDAGLRCDLNALESLARKGNMLVRVQAAFAFIHHGGFERAPLGALFCSCGGCEKDQLALELESLRRAVMLTWTGQAKVAHSASLSQGLFDETLTAPTNELVVELRLITRMLSGAVATGDEPRGVAAEEAEVSLEDIVALPRWSSLRWPLRLAMAIEAAAAGHPEIARRHVDSMPAWPEGSRLEAARRELLAALA